MNKLRVIRLLLCIVLAVFIGGCSFKNKEAVHSEGKLEDSILFINEWPENRFTETIPEPSVGKVDYVIDDSSNGKYAIFYSDISMDEAKSYIEELKGIGYHSVTDENEDVAIGTLLKRDAVMVSVSVSEGILGIYISIE